jgi:hypothetical protein
MSALGAVALGLGSAIAGGASFPLVDRLINGSPEEQMRRQAAIQEQIENERMARQSGAGNPDMAGLVGGRVAPMDLESLIAEDELTNQGSRLIQSERVLTPIEIIQMMEMAGG